MIIAASIVMALACVLASGRRLWLAAKPTALHPDDVVAWLGPSPDRSKLEALRAMVADVPDADWERDLLEALAQQSNEARAALVNEQLTELDLRMQRWARVPRVCASVSTSFGILLGTLVLRNGLANAPDLSGEVGELCVRGVFRDAMSGAAFGSVGTAFCIAVHAHARRMTRARLEATDRMIEKLEGAAAGPGPERSDDPHGAARGSDPRSPEPSESVERAGDGAGGSGAERSARTEK